MRRKKRNSRSPTDDVSLVARPQEKMWDTLLGRGWSRGGGGNAGGKAGLGRLSGEEREMRSTCAFEEAVVSVQAAEGTPLKAC